MPLVTSIVLSQSLRIFSPLIPAKEGIQLFLGIALEVWIPAFCGNELGPL